MAMESAHLTVDVVEATEFPLLARKNRVQGVPKTVLNDGALDFVGAQPEAAQVEFVLRAAGVTT